MKNFTFNINKNSYKVKILSHENNTINLEVNGTSYSVELDEEIKKQKTPVLVRRPAASPAPSEKPKAVNQGATNKNVITAPIPGLIQAINVKVGDTVKENQQLLVLEAMKMENNIMADRSGVVAAIHVTAGAQVLQGEVLIELE